MSMISLKGVSGGPDHHLVLNNISLDFGPGLTGLVGPNGAGKTTLLKTIMGLITPDAGAVCLRNKALSTLNLHQRAQQIAYLPQNGPVHWPMRVHDLVRLGRFSSTATQEEDEKAVREAMQACAIDGFAARTINTLSGGERSRVLLARALAAQTPILLVDEPTNALDPAQQHRIMGILQSRASEGVCVICAIHDLPLAARYGDRLVFLDEGGVKEDGPPKTVLTAASFHKTYGLAFDKHGYLDDEPTIL
jgi:iron complex transport system ATP-binding protein